jgi:hypothetical protein
MLAFLLLFSGRKSVILQLYPIAGVEAGMRRTYATAVRVGHQIATFTMPELLHMVDLHRSDLLGVKI